MVSYHGMQRYRSGYNGPDSKSCRSLSGVTSQTLDTSGFFGFSTLFQNWISTVFLRFVYDFYIWFSISRKPAKPWKYSMEMYRSGRNEADSKSESLRGTLHPKKSWFMQVFEGSKTKKSLSSPHQFSPFSKADWVKIQLGGLSEWSKVQHSKCALALAVFSAENPWFIRVFAGSNFKISYCSCVFFLHFLSARKTVEIYGGLSKRS